jgi:hypothetical protein
MSIFNFLLKSDLNTRELRINISELNEIYLFIKIENEIIKYPINNISSKGLAFLASENENHSYHHHQTLEAKIQFKSNFKKIKLEVVHINGNLIGCKVQEKVEEYKEIIRDYFSAEISALTVTQVGPENLKPDTEGKPYWFQSDQNCELFYVIGFDNLIKKFHLVVFGYSIIFDGEKIMMGTVWKDEPSDKMSYKKSDLILTAEKVPDSIKDYAIRFVEYIEKISGTHKRFIISHVKSI